LNESRWQMTSAQFDASVIHFSTTDQIRSRVADKQPGAHGLEGKDCVHRLANGVGMRRRRGMGKIYATKGDMTVGLSHLSPLRELLKSKSIRNALFMVAPFVPS
jgi:hypothetical protein